LYFLSLFTSSDLWSLYCLSLFTSSDLWSLYCLSLFTSSDYLIWYLQKKNTIHFHCCLFKENYFDKKYLCLRLSIELISVSYPLYCERPVLMYLTNCFHDKMYFTKSWKSPQKTPNMIHIHFFSVQLWKP
jgi:hypothetical protein